MKGERLKDLFFFKWDLVGGRTVLFRWVKTNARLLLDRWDEEEKEWVDDPAFIEVTGIGGSSDYDRISEEEVTRILIPSIGKEAATKALRAGIEVVHS